MPRTQEPIQVTSHVARDFMQNAAYFSTLQKVVWEYVSNSLDAAADDGICNVVVEITSHQTSIADNGPGMDREELARFFQMHGENVQRAKGKRVRGRFGTGKCAAFGVGNLLRIDTVKDGLRNVIELRRSDIEEARSGEPFPVRHLVLNSATVADHGTVVTVSEYNVRRPDVDGVIKYLERHLSRYRRRASVTVNGQECRYAEPLSVEVLNRTPPTDISKHLGSNVSLTIKVSPIPLDEETRGIDILSYGIWHETTLAGSEGKDRANYIFGEVDVPILEDGDWQVPAFDNTRNNTLNRQNPIVVTLLAWIGSEVEQVRQELVRREQERRRSDVAKQLEREAARIADVINDDFAQQEMELELRRRVARRSGAQQTGEILDEQGQLIPGDGEQETPWEQTAHPHGTSGHRGSLAGPGDEARPGPTMRPGEESGSPKGLQPGMRSRRRSVFSIDFETGGPESPRVRYAQDTETILINLDHLQIAGALEAGGGKTDSRQFREICHEVAAVEYAIVFQYKKLERDEQEATFVLDDLRNTINRVTKRFSAGLK
jgi:hypothetical protein